MDLFPPVLPPAPPGSTRAGREGGRERRWGWQTKEAESKAWNKESLEDRKPGSGGAAGEEQEEDGEQTPTFSPALQPMRDFSGSSLAQEVPWVCSSRHRALAASPLCVWLLEHPWLLGSVHVAPRLFLRPIPQFAVGLSLAQPQHKPKSSFLPSTL